MTREEIKLRQMTNQHLLAPVHPMTVVHDLCGLQAQFLSNALHGLRIRGTSLDEETVRREMVKSWTIRGTVHVFSREDLPLHVRPEVYRRNEWSEPCFWNQRLDWALTPVRQAELTEVILAALEDGERDREELRLLCRESGMTEAEEGSLFHPWGGGIRQLCERGFMHCVVDEGKKYRLSGAFEPLPEETAKLELARRYFTHMGPATIHDAMYFFGATAAQVKKWLSALPVLEVECEGRVYYYIENGVTLDHAFPQCVFLAGFDQLMLGYEKKESLYLPPEYLRRIFNLAGIVMPSVLLDGRVVARWSRKGRKLQVEPFEPLKEEVRGLIVRTAEACFGHTFSAVKWSE